MYMIYVLQSTVAMTRGTHTELGDTVEVLVASHPGPRSGHDLQERDMNPQ